MMNFPRVSDATYSGGSDRHVAVAVAGARCVEDLAGLVQGGGQPEYLMFWGHRPPGGGGVGRGCLSQWWPVTFAVDGHDGRQGAAVR
jgi:hypothetical protein